MRKVVLLVDLQVSIGALDLDLVHVKTITKRGQPS